MADPSLLSQDAVAIQRSCRFCSDFVLEVSPFEGGGSKIGMKIGAGTGAVSPVSLGGIWSEGSYLSFSVLRSSNTFRI